MLYVTYQDHSCHNDPALYRSNVNWFHQLQLADMKINWRVYLYQLCLTQINDHTEIADSIYPAVRGASFSNISTLDLNVRQLRRSLQIIQVLPPIPPPYSRRAFPEFSFRKCKQFSPAFSTSRSLPEHKYQADSRILFRTLFTLHCTNSPHFIPLRPSGNHILSSPTKSPRVSTTFLQHTLERF